jgi:nitroreductase
MNAEDLAAVLAARRSVRKFLPDPVPAADVDKIIDAARWAPSGSNSQNWSFIVVRSGEVRERMLAAVQERVAALSRQITSPRASREFIAYSGYYTVFAGAPVVIAVIKKPYISLNLRIMERYHILPQRWSSADIQGPAAAIQNMLLMTHALGYGACWMTGPLVAGAELEKILGIESPDQLMALVPVGKAAVTGAAPARKTPAEISRVIE